MADENYEPSPEAYAVAIAHTKRLRKAQCCLDAALNLARVLLDSLEDASDIRSMQAETVLKIIKKKLNKAHSQIDKHDAQAQNLCLAYFDLRAKSSGG